MKKILFVSFLLFPLYVHAEIASGSDCGENCHWSISETGTLTVYGENAKIGSFEGIQENGNTVGTTAPWGSYIDQIKNIEIKEGVVDLGYKAFSYIESQKPIEVPSTVSSISGAAFYRLRAPEVIMTDSVKEIKADAFSWSSIEKIDIPNSVTSIEGAFRGAKLIDVVIPSNVEYIAPATFSACFNLKSITIGENTALGSFLTHHKDNSTRMTDIANLKIYCMGDTAKCDANLAAAGYENLKSIKAEAKVINGITYIFDKKGNIVATSGTRTNKRIYTVEEASMVSGKKNSVMIRYK